MHVVILVGYGGSAGVISGALLYIREDFKSVDRETVLQVMKYFVAVAIKNTYYVQNTYSFFFFVLPSITFHSLLPTSFLVYIQFATINSSSYWNFLSFCFFFLMDNSAPPKKFQITTLRICILILDGNCFYFYT